jgi:acyl carrier protein
MMDQGTLKKIYEDSLNVKLDDFSELENIEIDSLDFIDIIFKIEKDLNIKISPEEFTNFELENPDSLVNYLRERDKLSS